jgi:hypothetical protein
VIPVNTGTTAPFITADVACARSNVAACTASAYLENVKVVLATDPVSGNPTTFLQVATLSSCVSCGTGTSVVGTVTLTTAGATQTLTATCNGSLVSVPGLATIQLNKQTCTNGVLEVDALYINLLSGAFIIKVGMSQEGATGCACTICSASPTCNAAAFTSCP